MALVEIAHVSGTEPPVTMCFIRFEVPAVVRACHMRRLDQYLSSFVGRRCLEAAHHLITDRTYGSRAGLLTLVATHRSALRQTVSMEHIDQKSPLDGCVYVRCKHTSARYKGFE